MINKIKRATINVVLGVVFILTVIIIIAPLIAEARFDAAEKLVTKSLWKDAEKKLGEAMRIDPYDSRYPARLGEFLFTQAEYKDNQTPLLKRAEGYYLRAVALNPRCAEYFVKLGQIYVSLSIEGSGDRVQGSDKKGYIDCAFENFNRAIKNDPNGFNTAYAVGYSGLSVWKYLDKSEKLIVINRLRYSLKQDPSYSEYIYPHTLKETESFKIMKLIIPKAEMERWLDMKMINDLKKNTSRDIISSIILKPTWKGTSASGRNSYKDGEIEWDGTIYGLMLIPNGKALITIEARGTPANGIYPNMIVSLDGKIIGSVYVNSPKTKEYVFSVDSDGGVKVLGITFTNDGCNETEDRNLYIGNAQVEQK